MIQTKEQMDAMDKEISGIDLRIANKRVTINRLEDELALLLIKIERHKRDLRLLGMERARAGTFELL